MVGEGQTNNNDERVMAEAGAQQNIQTTIINDRAAVWIVLVLLAFVAAYALDRSFSAIDKAAQAETDARLAQYYATDLKVFMGMQGMKPPSEPWGTQKSKGPKK